MGNVYETLSGASGIRAEGTSAQNIAEYNAQVAEQQGKAAKVRSGFDSIQQAKEAERIKSSLRAGLGAAGGLDAPVGTDIIGEQAEESELENLLIGFEGETALSRAKSQATGERLRGKAAKARAKNAARRANINFGIQLAGMAAGAAFAPAGFGTANTAGLGTGNQAGMSTLTGFA